MPRDLILTTDDGLALEAQLDGADGAVGAVVLCHPHPAYGGDMRAGVIDTLFRELPGRRLAVLRFNFRGVGASTGAHDGGGAERRDVAAAARSLQEEVGTGIPLTLAGWSFGADVALATDVEGARAWFGVAPVLGVVAPATMVAAHDERPTLLLVPEHDQHCPPSVAAERTAGWRSVTRHTLPGTDHFLFGRQAEVVDALAVFARAS